MGLKFKKDAEPVASDDFWYDLFYGGRIDPSDFLEKEDANHVIVAQNLLEEFENQMERRELVVYY